MVQLLKYMYSYLVSDTWWLIKKDNDEVFNI